MIHLRQSITIERPREAVFELVDDPSRYPGFFVGITRWESRSKRQRGVGARYRVLMRVGSIEAGGVVRVSERKQSTKIAWTSETGIAHQGRWLLEPDGRSTRLALEMSFQLAGGPVGWLVERLAGRMVSRNMWATLLAARRLLETGP